MYCIAAVALLSLAATASGAVTAETNYNPVTIVVNSAPYDVIATPITPDAPYSQAKFQCNVTGDTRYPAYASGTFPLNVSVPVGQKVRIIFANGNLNGATVTQQGEPGVIVQQGGSPIVQQLGGASPIVQKVGSPIVQQSASPAVVVQQSTPTVVQQQTWQPAPTVAQPAPVVYQSAAPTTPTASTPVTPASTQSTATTAASPPPTATTAASPPPTTTTATSPPPAAAIAASLPPLIGGNLLTVTGRKMLQDTVPGGPNNGLVEYVALASANTVPGFYAGSTQFGVPYVEFTASDAARGLVASFKGVLEVAQVVGGVPLYPFRPNPSLSPECQVNVNFKVL